VAPIGGRAPRGRRSLQVGISSPAQEETVTGPHEPEEHPEGQEEPWYGTGYDDGPATSEGPFADSAEASEPPVSGHHPAEHPDGPTDPPTQPGMSQPGMSHPPTPPVGEPATVRAESPGPAEAPRPGWWRSRRVRVGAAATLAGLVLLGGGFGAGYAVADASAPAAAHTTSATGAGQGTAKAQAARKRRQAQRRQHQGGATPPGTAATPGAGTAPGAPAGAPTF
jgi:hypothetical protein